MRSVPLAAVRRTALAAQGFDQPRPRGRIDVRHFRRTLGRIDLVQLDSVNVVTRAHEMPFFSRLGPYEREALNHWLWRSREAFEGWVHVASLMPMDGWPLVRPRDTAAVWTRFQHLQATDPGYLDAVLAEIALRGPTSVSDLADPGRRTGPWWGVPKGKVALHGLFRRGELAVHDRTAQFVTRYDLAERVIPRWVRDSDGLTADRASQELLMRAARALGIGTARDLADYHRLPIQPARQTLEQLVSLGRLDQVQVEGWREPAYRHPQARLPRRVEARALVGPFDPLVWERNRVERIFGFRYRIEIYVPASERVYGYYVLPFLLGDSFVARVDLKADRSRRVLHVLGAYAEPDVDRLRVARELAAELRDLAGWLGLDDVAPGRKGDLAAALRRQLT